MRLSIVIPVYKVEATLRRCIDSVASQNFGDMEIILVDDASPDKCGHFCDTIAEGDKRIKVLHHKANKGLSAARNTGISIATGDYITFVDSDDHIARGTYQALMSEIDAHPEYDILEYPVCEHYDSSGQHLLKFRHRTFTDMAQYWLEGQVYRHTYAWNKIYRIGLFDNVAFPEGKNFEDVWTLPQLLRQCHTVATTDAGLYYYTNNPNGITRQATATDLASHLQAHISVIRRLHPTPSEKTFPSFLTDAFARYYASVLNIMLDVGDKTSSSNQNNEHLLQSFPILPYKQTIKLRLLHLLGQKRLCQIHKLLRHARL